MSVLRSVTLDTTSCRAVWICTRVHGAAAFCARELLVENYGKVLASSNRSTPLSESRARNLSSPVFVVWQQYGYEKRSTMPAEARSIRSLCLQTA
jgi:hypothetical protein